MKKSISSFIFALAALSVFFFNSCEVGLGKSPDLEAPVIKITSMESGGTVVNGSEFGSVIYCKRDAVFKGTATDNERVQSVFVEIKWDGEEKYTYLTGATLRDDSWIADINFDKEGVASLKFSVTDYAENYSTRSSQVITLFIDDTAPVGNTWYIDRKVNGIQYSLRDRTYLEGLNLDDSENKDAAQNVSFSIRGSFSDTMGIKNVYIELFDEGGNKLCKIDKTEDSGLYAPEFLVTASDLSALNDDKHYIEVRYSAEDVVTVPESNKVEHVKIPSGWFIWWPDSDKPRIVPSTAPGEDNILHLNIKTTLSLTLFDDDCLDEAYCALLTNSEYTALSSNWITNPESIYNATNDNDRKGKFESDSHNTTREVVKPLKAPDTPDTTMHLVAYAKDISYALDGTENPSEITIIDVPVQVTDISTPKLFITSPSNNSIPTMVMADNNSKANVTITGQTLDTTGCEFLEFVWVPNSITNKYATAKEWLDTLTTKESHNELAQSPTRTKTYNGMKLWSVPLTTAPDEGSFKKHTFSFTVDLFNDFIKPGTSENEKKYDKYFLVKLTRLDGNSIYSEYTLKKDDTPPIIIAVNPSGDMQAVSNEGDYTLKFYATKASGLPIDINEYKIDKIEGTTAIPVEGAAYNNSTGYYEAVISNADLTDMSSKGEKPKYRFTAKDVFEKSSTAQYTLIVSSLSSLTSVSSTSPDKLKKGDSVDITVAFSKAVNLVATEKSETEPHLWLKIKGITNTTCTPNKTSTSAEKAKYVSGDGSTTLHFEYQIEDGDYTNTNDVLKLFADASNIVFVTDNDAASASFTSDRVIIGSFTNEFDTKNIKVDGVSPKIANNGIQIETTGTTEEIAAITNNGVKYLREGKTLTVKVTTTEPVTVQGNPKFKLTTSEGDVELDYAGQTDTESNTTITFSKRIASDDKNGRLSYSPTSCISGTAYILDSYNNPLTLSSGNTVTTTFYIDTKKPKAPSIMDESGATGITSNYYQTSLKFIVVKDPTDATINKSQYSTNGGNNWSDYSSVQTLTKSAQLTAQSIDYAGNISDPAPVLTIDIKNAFPNYTFECITPNGYLNAGEKIQFKVSFDAKVKKTTNNAKIYLSKKENEEVISTNAYAELKSTNADPEDPDGWFTTATFEYTVQKDDQFTIKVKSGNANNEGLHLDDIKDEYGFTGSGLTTDYSTEVVCDGVIPYIKSMTPDGETESGSNVYKNGRKITIVFNEPVQKGTGNITLRLVKKWAIPPVISGDDFNTILNAIPSSWSVTTTKNNASITLNGKQVLCMDEAEDVQDLRTGIKYDNDYYHGSGQYIGPYKKSSYGIKSDGSPKTDEVAYVLDVNMGIWETSDAHYYGTTYKSNGTATEPETLTAANSTKITADNIRNTLEAAGFHERVLDVTAEDYVKPSETTVDGKTVKDYSTYIIEFPKGLIDDDDDLPNGREWELVIEKGAFVDYTGKEFGSKYSSEAATTTTKTPTDSIMKNDGELTDSLGTWDSASAGRGRSTVTGTAKPVVLVKTTNDKNSFWSDKVATPVIRIDRYSYGVGVKQSDASGNLTTSAITSDDTAAVSKPTGYVRVRIDCETDDVTIEYGKSLGAVDTTQPIIADTELAKTVITGSKDNNNDDYKKNEKVYSDASCWKYKESSNIPCYSYVSTTGLPATALDSLKLGSSYTKDTFFAAGNGKHNESCKDYIVAQAKKTGFTSSDLGKECAFQTVVRFYRPWGNTNENNVQYSAGLSNGHTDFSIRGTTYWGGEPTIVPYPLRDSRPGSCYLRRCYRDIDTTNGVYDYYWVSYEILVESSYSGYNWIAGNYYDWCQNWGYMYPGELSICVNMKSWN